MMVQRRGPAVWTVLSAFLALGTIGGGCSGGDSTPTDTADGEDDSGDGARDEGGGDAPPEDVASRDEDGDGYPVGEDCDDHDFTVHPGAQETCNGVDDDCDGTTDEDDAVDARTWYPDADGDGFGDPAGARRACEQPAGYVIDLTDCDDDDDEVNPDGTEACNGTDDDCDGETDEEGATGSTTWYADLDGDGYGNTDSVLEACSMPVGYSPIPGDCDDALTTVNPAAPELCSSVGTDDDCDGETDETTAIDAAHWYADADADGFGDPAAGVVACTAPAGYIGDATDCDDTLAAVNPAVADVPDELDWDENCDGIDGDIAHSIFVSGLGGDDRDDGLGSRDVDGTLAVRPVRTPARGLELAAAQAASTGVSWDVLLATGTYNVGAAPLELAEGVDVIGGYDDSAGWAHDRTPGETIVTGNDGTGVLHAHAVTRDTLIGFLTVLGATVATPGGSSAAVVVTDTPTEGRLTFRFVRLAAGAGGPGPAGAAGLPVACLVCAGGAGGPRHQECTSQYGSAGASAAGAYDCRGVAGAGGYGPTGDCCSSGTCYERILLNGDPGGAGGHGESGPGGSASATTLGMFGADGAWSGLPSGDGQSGGRGGGGGGGGSGSGVNDGAWYCGGAGVDGGAGGRGGAGGCEGAGGQPGTAGGAAIALVVVGSHVTFDNSSVYLGFGGAGGTGGEGGWGGPGLAGLAGQPGTANVYCDPPRATIGGGGGNGGCGGGGGGGAGGNGGPSIGIALVRGATAAVVVGLDDPPDFHTDRPAGLPGPATAAAGAGGAGGGGGAPGCAAGSTGTDGVPGTGGAGSLENVHSFALDMALSATIAQTDSASAGVGGTLHTDSCPAGQVLIGLNGAAKSTTQTWLGQLQAICGDPVVSCLGGTCSVTVTPTTPAMPTRGSSGAGATSYSESCAAGQAVVGFSGRNGGYIDQLVLRCAPLQVALEGSGFIVTLGAVSSLAPVGGSGGAPFVAIDCPAGQAATVTRIRASTAAIEGFGLGCATPTVGYF